MNFLITIERLINFLIALFTFGVVLSALVLQVQLNELPCPLCLLQRVGFLMIGFGFLLNLKFGFKPAHYSIILVSGLFTSFVALRQIALHVLPGTGVYGSPLFGLHLYTWAFILSIVIVAITAFILGFERQYQVEISKRYIWQFLNSFLFLIAALLIIANLVSVIFECGLSECPENPVSYKLLQKK